MNRESLLDRLLPIVFAVLLHAAVASVLIFRLADTSAPVAAGPRVEPVEAVLVDEKQIADELERLRENDEQRRKKERERIEQLEKEAESARSLRTEEERRIFELERMQRERQREYIAAERERERQDKERLAELTQKRESETRQIEVLEKEKTALAARRAEEQEQLALIELQRREEEGQKRRIEEQTQVAKAAQMRAEEARRKAEAQHKRSEAAKKKAEAERKRIEAAKKKAEAERKLAEAAKKKAEAERKRIEAARKKTEEARRREAEIALQEAIAQDARQLDKEILALLDAGRMEYIAQIKDKIERNWLRPPGTAFGLKCVVRVSQIPGGEVVQAEILTGSGDVAFDRSVEEAVLRSSPLPVPKDPSLFDRHIEITFEPEV